VNTSRLGRLGSLGRLGLVGVKERVEQLNGELEIISSENGTCAKVIL
jgi:signal transduction histidine kinase